LQLSRRPAIWPGVVACLAFTALPLSALAATPARTDATAPRAAAPAAPASPPAAAALSDNRGHLYYLDGWGGLHPADGSPKLPTSAYWPGWDIANAIAP